MLEEKKNVGKELENGIYTTKVEVSYDSISIISAFYCLSKMNNDSVHFCFVRFIST